MHVSPWLAGMEERGRDEVADIAHTVAKSNNPETRLEYHDEQQEGSSSAGQGSENVQKLSRKCSSGHFLSLLSCCIVCVGAFSQGALFMWNSAALPQMRNMSGYVDHIPPVTDMQASCQYISVPVFLCQYLSVSVCLDLSRSVSIFLCLSLSAPHNSYCVTL